MSIKMSEIEHDVELPDKRIGNISWSLKFRDMKAGDSFTITTGSDDAKLIRKRVASASIQWGKNHGEKFATRMLDEHTVFVKRME